MIEEFNFEKCLQKQLSGLISLKLYGCVGSSFDINPHTLCLLFQFSSLILNFSLKPNESKKKNNFSFTCMFILF